MLHAHVGTPADGTFFRRVGSALAAVLVGAMLPVLAASPAAAVSGAAFTTNVDGERVNQNHYADKCDVYINGGPNNGANQLTDGTYFFAVLEPGGQPNPNDGGDGNLSDDVDTSSNRQVTVQGGKIRSTSGTHESRNDPSTALDVTDKLVQLCQYADTSNPGGVYILALCLLPSPGATVHPRDCKYDAFKVRSSGGDTPANLVALKDATPSFSRAYTWDVEKSVDRTRVEQSGGSATFNYVVTATKSAATDSAHAVSGSIVVFNPNSATVTGVSVTDSTLGRTCAVTGGATSIAGGESATFGYVCNLSGLATSTTTGTNTATVAWDPASIRSPGSSTTATAPYDFAGAVPTVTGNSTDVTDTFGLSGTSGTQQTLATGITSSQTFPDQRTIAIPSRGCLTYDNTARVTGDSDSESVTVCRTSAGGFTMGFWQNKNGQARIEQNRTGLCSYLSSYRNVLSDLPTGTACTTSGNLKSYVTRVIKAAQASGDGAPMYKAQFLATALSAYNTSLAGTSVVLTSREAGLLGLTTCATVSSILQRADANYPALSSGAKEDFMLIKTLLDRINNNQTITC